MLIAVFKYHTSSLCRVHISYNAVKINFDSPWRENKHRDSNQNCKNNCPACSRVCPAEAVIFPKYERSPINGGSASEEGVIMLDMDTMYADALRARLEQRRASVMLFKDKK